MFSLFVALVAFLPVSVFAASLYFDTPQAKVSVGDTVLIVAHLNTQGDSINVVDGVITLEGAVENISGISVAHSAFTLWPRTPSLSGRTITFVGGVPGGSVSSDAVLFEIAYTPETVGTITFTPNIHAYKNDGTGTSVPVQGDSFSLVVGPRAGAAHDAWQETITKDTVPPAYFEVVMGEDPSVFDGKKFISFQTTDAQSGIDHYEVIEGDAPPVRASGTYVLQHQEESPRLRVRAYDKAGNVRESVYGQNQWFVWVMVCISAGILIALVLWFRRRSYI